MVSIKSKRLSAWFERLSDRERKIVLVGGSLLLLVAVGLGIALVQQKVSALEEEVTAGEEALAELTKQAPDYLRRKAEKAATEAQLEKEIRELLRKAEILDAQEDGKYGKGKLGSDLPDELRRRQDRLARIRQARKEMEAETAAATARQRKQEAEEARARAAAAREGDAPAAEQAELNRKVEMAEAKVSGDIEN